PAPLFGQVLGLFDLPLDALLQAKRVLAGPCVHSDSGHALGCYPILAVGEPQLGEWGNTGRAQVTRTPPARICSTQGWRGHEEDRCARRVCRRGGLVGWLRG